MRTLASVCLVAFLASLPAQVDPKPPAPAAAPAASSTRSLAAGLVRQQAELEKVKAPSAASPDEAGAGKGPMALLVRRADGTVAVHEIERGAGDHGPAAEPLAEMPEEQEVDAPPVPQAVQVKVLRRGEDLVVQVPGTDGLVGKQVDRQACRRALDAARPPDPKARFSRTIALVVASDLRLQDVTTVWELARDAGWTAVTFEPMAGVPRDTLHPDAHAAIEALPAKHGWPVRPAPIPIHDGELLVLVEGSTPWGECDSLLRACAKAGIWQVAFVVTKDGKTWGKLPVHLPMH